MEIKLIYPINIALHSKSQGFDENPYHLNYAQFGLENHNGDDFVPYDGQSHEVSASDAGTVERIYQKSDYGYGFGVCIRHKWGKTKYGHFAGMPLVKVGQKVDQGQHIGWTGNSGFSTILHLHFGVYPFGVSENNGFGGAVDPTPYYVALASPPPAQPPSLTPLPELNLIPGEAVITLPSGVRVRLSPTTSTAQNIAGMIYPGTPFTILDETVTEGDVVFRSINAWIAQSEGGKVYMMNLAS